MLSAVDAASEGEEPQLSTMIKCKVCGKVIVRNVRGEWGLPHSLVPTIVCRDGKPHEPDTPPGRDPTGAVTAIAVSTSIVEGGLI